jgi:hypothetical protein
MAKRFKKLKMRGALQLNKVGEPSKRGKNFYKRVQIIELFNA